MGKSRAERWIHKGESLCKQEKFQDAVIAYEKAIVLDPANIDGWNGLVRCRFSSKDWKGVIVASEQALSAANNMHRDNHQIWGNLALAQKQSGNLAGAAEVYDKALVTAKYPRESQRAKDFYELAQIRESLGNLSGAIEAYEAARPGIKQLIEQCSRANVPVASMWTELPDKIETLRRKHAQVEADMKEKELL